MKKCHYLLMVMLLALFSAGLASCGDDDEPKFVDIDIVGTWAFQTDMEADFALFFQFTKDGKFHEVLTSIVNGETTYNAFHGTYTVSGNMLHIIYTFQNETETETIKCLYSVKGDKLMLYLDNEDPVVFTRVKDSVIEPYL
jgi:uncharacterized protein (TIGR03066 family)